MNNKTFTYKKSGVNIEAADKFVNFCAEKGSVKVNKQLFTVLLAPMKGFYTKSNFGKTQVRLALVEDSYLLSITPQIIASLFKSFSNT